MNHPRKFRAAVPFVLAIAASTSAGSAQEPAKKRLSFEDTQQPIQWTGRLPMARFAWDGMHVEYDAGKVTRWFDPATRQDGEPQEAPAQPADDAPAPKTFVARIHKGDVWVEPGRAAPAGGRGRRGRGLRGGEPGEDAVQATVDGASTGDKAMAQCNAAGTRASFVRGGDLFVVEVGSHAEWQVTADGANKQLNGMLDWVYQEEVYGRGDFQGHWWSPVGDSLAVLSLDESKVRAFTIVDHVPPGFLDKERGVRTEPEYYPKVGDPNPTASLAVVDAAAKKTVKVDLSAYPQDVLVVRVEWTDKGQLLVTLQDRIQTWAELGAVDLATGKFTKWIREESKTWVNRPESPRWLADGTFLWLSERTGFQHVYRYKPGGELVAAVTSGEWQVRSYERVDEPKGALWFEGSKDGATGRHLYRVPLAGGDAVAVTPGVGTHLCEFSRDGAFLIDRWSAMDMPTAVRVLDANTGEVVREIGKTAMDTSSGYAFAPKERLSIPARDGCMLDASLMLPPDRKDGARLPIYLPTYSGPDAPSVRDMWMPSTYQVFCAQQGFAVLQVNVRTASSRGRRFIGECYKRLGEQELKDLEDAIAWVCEHRGGDPARVAIEGWSYGGFMAAYALTHSDKFALGIAGAGVYDWRLYDSIYTERYMRTPDDNKDGYDATSVIKAAKNLKGHLVLLHGTMDDNVHLQNTMQLLWELEKAGKQNFELMLYPRSQHGLAREVAGHSRVYQWRCLSRLLDPAWRSE